MDNGKYQLEIKSTITNEHHKELRKSSSLSLLIMQAFLFLISIKNVQGTEKVLKLRQLWKRGTFFFRNAKDVIITPVKHFSFPAECLEPVIQPIATILYLHGGGYCLGSLETHRAFLTYLCHITNTRILSIDYRLAPENPFPAALEDAMEAYRWLRNQKCSSSVYISGDSAGGGLAISLILALKEQHAQLPEGGICFSPWTDLTLQGKTLVTNQKSDRLLKRQYLARVAELYISDQNPSSAYLSPLYGDLRGLPPLFIQVAKEEILLSDSLRLFEKIKKIKGLVTLEIWRNRFHAWPYMAPVLPEAKQSLHHVRKFIEENDENLRSTSGV